MQQEERLEHFKDEVRERLKNVCSNFSDAEFDDLIDKIADNEMKTRKPGWPATRKRT